MNDKSSTLCSYLHRPTSGFVCLSFIDKWAIKIQIQAWFLIFTFAWIISCSEYDVQQSSTDSSSWLSAPHIEVQAASPLAQSPASEEESADAERDSSAGYVNQTTSEIANHVEDQELEHEEHSSKVSELEMPQDSDPRTDTTDTIPADDEGEPIEGRLSADTSEQIFISQQIEAKTALDQRQANETSFPAEHLTLGLEESEHATLPTDSLESHPASDTDQPQSPYKTSTGNI